MKKQLPKYYIAYERDHETRGYIASAPALPGCAVYGKTIREAYRNITSAIEECLAVLCEFKKTPPPETIRPQILQKFSFVMPALYGKNEINRVR